MSRLIKFLHPEVIAPGGGLTPNHLAQSLPSNFNRYNETNSCGDIEVSGQIAVELGYDGIYNKTIEMYSGYPIWENDDKETVMYVDKIGWRINDQSNFNQDKSTGYKARSNYDYVMRNPIASCPADTFWEARDIERWSHRLSGGILMEPMIPQNGYDNCDWKIAVYNGQSTKEPDCKKEVEELSNDFNNIEEEVGCTTCEGGTLEECLRNSIVSECPNQEDLCQTETQKDSDGNVVKVKMGCKQWDAFASDFEIL